jgi:hypothetical protein
MELIDVVRKLVGPIDPIGSTHVDEDRYKNLVAMTDLVDRLLSDIDRVIPNRTRQEASMKRAGEYAKQFFDHVGIEE